MGMTNIRIQAKGGEVEGGEVKLPQTSLVSLQSL